MSISFEDVRATISIYLQKANWGIEYNIRLPGVSASIDIVASKGGVRKKKIFIAVAENPFEAGIIGYTSFKEIKGGKKYIFLREGEPLAVSAPAGISVVSRVEDLVE